MDNSIVEYYKEGPCYDTTLTVFQIITMVLLILYSIASLVFLPLELAVLGAIDDPAFGLSFAFMISNLVSKYLGIISDYLITFNSYAIKHKTYFVIPSLVCSFISLILGTIFAIASVKTFKLLYWPNFFLTPYGFSYIGHVLLCIPSITYSFLLLFKTDQLQFIPVQIELSSIMKSKQRSKKN